MQNIKIRNTLWYTCIYGDILLQRTWFDNDKGQLQCVYMCV